MVRATDQDTFDQKALEAGLVVNGGVVRSDGGGTVPFVNSLSLGRKTNGSPLNGHIKSIRYYPRRLSNAQLQALTA